jgi:hypothetical protein
VKLRRTAARLFMLAALVACNKAEPGGPEVVADAFCDAYFVHADQQRAMQFTAFGATKMLEQEIADTKPLRESGYTPGDASLEVGATRGARQARNDRVRFDYAIRTRDNVRHADVELARVDGEWKVVRLGVSDSAAPQ